MARLPGKNTGKRAAELRMLRWVRQKEQIFGKTLALQLSVLLLRTTGNRHTCACTLCVHTCPSSIY